VTACELSTTQLKLIQASAELGALSDCLRLDADDAGGDRSDFRYHLSEALKRIGRTLWDLTDEVGGCR
jgi:hypothetical protein